MKPLRALITYHYSSFHVTIASSHSECSFIMHDFVNIYHFNNNKTELNSYRLPAFIIHTGRPTYVRLVVSQSNSSARYIKKYWQ